MRSIPMAGGFHLREAISECGPRVESIVLAAAQSASLHLSVTYRVVDAGVDTIERQRWRVWPSRCGDRGWRGQFAIVVAGKHAQVAWRLAGKFIVLHVNDDLVCCIRVLQSKLEQRARAL